ncbi:MAG: hypothetical protein JXQ29_17650 [Planctomycetes bacterium]|nr:hypothetical protein [Planctomycetota bacterium]
MQGRRGAARRRALWAALGIGAALVLVRFLLVESYIVSTPSMAPTFRGDPAGGDRVLVDRTRFVRAAPPRWGLAVFRGAAGEGPFLKRVVGLPGDEIAIVKGDVLNHRKVLVKPRALLRRLLVPVYESAAEFGDFAACWCVLDGECRPGAAGLRLTPGASGEAVFQTRDEVTDGLLDAAGRFQPGEHAVGDVELSVTLRTELGCEEVAIGILDGFDRLIVSLRPAAPARVFLPRRDPLEIAGLGLEPGAERTLRVSNVDDRLVIVRDGDDLLALDYASNNLDRPGEPEGRRNLVEVRVRGRAGGVVRRLGLRRDIFYVAAGHHGARPPAGVGADNYYMLGDHSRESRDSRHFGPVPRSRLIGAPFLVYWPPSRIRLF